MYRNNLEMESLLFLKILAIWGMAEDTVKIPASRPITSVTSV